jgi:hypothetical protein
VKIISRERLVTVDTPCVLTWSPSASVAIEVHAKDSLEALYCPPTFLATSFSFPKVLGVFELPRPVFDKRQKNSNRGS